jgi:DNA-binding NtrC family response regulator
VRVPGLNERPEDIPLLVLHVLAQWAARDPNGLCARFFEKAGPRPPAPRVDPALVEALLQHEYTHHVRELESVLWTALSTSPDNTVELTDQVRAKLRAAERPTNERPVHGAHRAQRGTATVETAGGADSGPSQAAPAEDAERQAIRAALAKTGGKVAPAAELLGLSRHALHRRLKRHGLRGSAAEGESAGD